MLESPVLIYLALYLVISVFGGYYALKSLHLILSHTDLKSQLIIWQFILISGGFFSLSGIAGTYSIISGHEELLLDHIIHYSLLLFGHLFLTLGIYKYYNHINNIIKAIRKTRTKS